LKLGYIIANIIILSSKSPDLKSCAGYDNGRGKLNLSANIKKKSTFIVCNQRFYEFFIPQTHNRQVSEGLFWIKFYSKFNLIYHFYLPIFSIFTTK